MKLFYTSIFLIFPIVGSAGLLTINGAAIHPKCMELFTDMPHTKRILRNIEGMGELFTPRKLDSFINLTKCADFSKPFTTKKDGTLNYVDKTSKSSMRKPMTEYRPLLEFGGDKVLIEYMWNGGGSGYFSGLQIIKKHKNKLELIGTLPISGDRCNGGFRVDKKLKSSVTILRNLTPIAIVELTKLGKSLKLEAYEDLEASANSCFASERLTLLSTKNGIEQRSDGIKVKELGISELTKTKWNQNYNYQLCFSQVLDKFADTFPKRFIPLIKLDGLIQTFKKTCLVSKKMKK
jgi:hypothetical protein